MANKSYASSEIGGGEESVNGDPEFSKDFNSAYQKVIELINESSWWKRFIKNKETLSSYLRMKSIRLSIWYTKKLMV
jgi:hypothetical protein